MNRFKNIALNALSIIIAIAALGFFASIGLAVVGFALLVGVIGLIVARISGLFAPSNATRVQSETTA